MLMGRVIIEDDVNDFPGGNLGFDGVEEADKLLSRWRCMLRPMMVPSSTLSAANRVVVPCRLQSWVIVPARPFFMGKPGWVRSSAWIWLFSSNDRTMEVAG